MEDLRQCTGHPDYEGWVWKKSRHVKKWRQRWAVVEGNWLYTFKDQQVYDNPTEILNLRDFTKITNVGQTDKGHCFVVTGPEKEFNFAIFQEADFDGKFSVFCTHNLEWKSRIEMIIMGGN